MVNNVGNPNISSISWKTRPLERLPHFIIKLIWISRLFSSAAADVLRQLQRLYDLPECERYRQSLRNLNPYVRD